VCAVEFEPYRVETFRRHTPAAELLNCDIRKVDLSKYKGKVQVIYGGPPCQPFSSGGLRKADQDERDMIPFYVKAVSTVRPVAFVMENVPGLVASDRLRYLQKVIKQLQGLGYSPVWKLL